MAAKRYELNDAQWAKIALLLPGKAGDPGRTGSDNRLFVNGCLWVLRSGAHWCDLPERYGRWKTVHRRFSRWCDAGVWERVFDALTMDRDNQYLMIDSTIVRAHQQAATGKGGSRPGAGAFPRRTDHQNPYARRRAGTAVTLLRHGRTGPRHHRCAGPARRSAGRAVLADKTYDSNSLRETIAQMEAQAVIPSKRHRKLFIPHDTELYKQRNRIERCFNRLKHFRRFATRYDRRTIHFAGFIYLAATMIWLR